MSGDNRPRIDSDKYKAMRKAGLTVEESIDIALESIKGRTRSSFNIPKKIIDHSARSSYNHSFENNNWLPIISVNNGQQINTQYDSSGNELFNSIANAGYIVITDKVRVAVVDSATSDGDSKFTDRLCVNSVKYTWNSVGSEWDMSRGGGHYDNHDGVVGIQKVSGVIHGEDLEVGAGNSEPIKIRTDDKSLPGGEKHHVVIALCYVWDNEEEEWIPKVE